MPPPIKCQKDNLSLNIIKAQRPDPIGSPSKEMDTTVGETYSSTQLNMVCPKIVHTIAKAKNIKKLKNE